MKEVTRGDVAIRMGRHVEVEHQLEVLGEGGGDAVGPAISTGRRRAVARVALFVAFERWVARDRRAAALRAASAGSSHLQRRSEVAGPVAACGRDGEPLAAEADLHATESLALLRVQPVAVEQDGAAGEQGARRRDAFH